jgi:cholera toxin transcriptional activator
LATQLRVRGLSKTIARRGYRFLADVQWQGDAVGTTQPQEAAQTSELPAAHRGITRVLFALIQSMYLIFYLVAMVHWLGIERVPWVQPHALAILCFVLVTAAIGIPVRLYLFSAVLFDYARLGVKFARIFPGLFILDELWAIAPFLVFEQIGFGASFAATAALLYVPFAERTLVRMAYPVTDRLLQVR